MYAIRSYYDIGNGVQWSAYPHADTENAEWGKLMTDEKWQMVFDRLDYMKRNNFVQHTLYEVIREGQIGTAIIEREGNEASIKAYAKFENIADLSKVEIKAIELAYGASSVSVPGTFLDFDNADTTCVITVASGAGETLDWTINLKPFKSDMEGTWYIGEIGMYCNMFTWESWGWHKYEKINNYLPELNPELDNVLIFTVEGADKNGNPFGNYNHTAGNDGKYGNFGDQAKGWDFNTRFRKIPAGEGTWMRDFARNVVVITDQNNVTYELDLEVLPETNEVALKAALPYLANLFNWSNTDWAYEELAHMSNPMWYKLTRVRPVQTGNAITALTVKDQVGSASIDNGNKTVTVTIADNGADRSSIEIVDIATSYAATASKTSGQTLDFSVNNSAEITVTSESGETATWTIMLQIDLDPSDVSIAGTWTIGEIGVYCDLFTWESWGWDKSEKLNNYLPNAGAELDNTITFTVEGKNAQDQPYGTFENNTGADGKYGNFVSDDASWPETDFNNSYNFV